MLRISEDISYGVYIKYNNKRHNLYIRTYPPPLLDRALQLKVAGFEER